MLEELEASGDLEAVLTEEWRALAARVDEQRDRADRLRALAEQVDEQARRDEGLLAELKGLTGIAPQLRIETLDRELRGRRLREVAIEILEADVGRGEPIHYKEWFQRLRDRGHRVSGRDPVANFLAQISRDPEIERVGSRTGLYQLRAA